MGATEHFPYQHRPSAAVLPVVSREVEDHASLSWEGAGSAGRSVFAFPPLSHAFFPSGSFQQRSARFLHQVLHAETGELPLTEFRHLLADVVDDSLD